MLCCFLYVSANGAADAQAIAVAIRVGGPVRTSAAARAVAAARTDL